MKTVCHGCDKYAIVWDAPPEVARLGSPDPAPVAPPVSPYRCREHLDQVVSWRGTGCRLCPKRKPKIRKASRSSDNETEY
jgi:hypothetical protein